MGRTIATIVALAVLNGFAAEKKESPFKQLEEARAKFAVDDSAKNVYDWTDAAKADWKAFFNAIPHDGTDAEHKDFYTDRYYEETK